jgi:hypothetical protein
VNILEVEEGHDVLINAWLACGIGVVAFLKGF